MIARIIIPLFVGIVLPYLWLDRHELRPCAWWRRCLLWLPAILMLGYSVYLALLPDFVPSVPLLIDVWFGLMAVFAVPQFVYAFFCSLGCLLGRWLPVCRQWGSRVGVAMAVVAFGSFVYGFTQGFRNLEVKHVTLYFPDLPRSFDGYRIVQFGDIHIGSFYGWRSDLPQRDVDSILAQHPDMICFTGDLQNAHPSEIEPYKKLLGSLRAKDGVFSVLGNHDYSKYVDADSIEKRAIERRVCALEREMGWQLLCNEHQVVRRGTDSIYVAGTENYDRPKHTDVAKALYGIPRGAFVLMLQHIPTQWREMWPSDINEKHGSRDTVLQVAPQLTLSGHTHAGQVRVLGLRPTIFAPFDYGLYEREGCQLYTTAGLGGVVPIRIGATAEIVVFTLKTRH